MTEVNRQELRRLAEVAGPGPWYVENGMDQVRDNADDFVCATGENEPRNTAFIAAANPSTILSLLDELEKAQEIGRISCNFDGYKSVLDERDQLRAEVEGLRKDAERYRDALADVAAQVDGNIRAAVRDCVNFIGDVQDIYGYCDQIDAIIDTAIDPDLAKEGNANG